MSTLSVRLPDSLHKQIRFLAKREGMGRTQREAVRWAVPESPSTSRERDL